PAASEAFCQRTSFGSVKLPWAASWAAAGVADAQTAISPTARAANTRIRFVFMGDSFIDLISLGLFACQRTPLGEARGGPCERKSPMSTLSFWKYLIRKGMKPHIFACGAKPSAATNF